MRAFLSLSLALVAMFDFPWDGVYHKTYTFAPTSCAAHHEKSVLILGNSITYHPPHGDWTGDWGMAATGPQSDYVHQLGQGLANRLCGTIRVTAAAVWLYEWHYDQFDFSLLEGMRQPDLLIVRFGDNTPEAGDLSLFQKKTDEMIKYISARSVLVSSTYYPRPLVSEALADLGYPFVDISHLWSLPETHANATNSTIPAAIGEHPGDLGMTMIANALFSDSLLALAPHRWLFPIAFNGANHD